MSGSGTNSVSAKLEVLRQKFKDKAVHEFDALNGIADAVESSNADCQQLAHAYQILHRLAGSAGTFGFGELGDEARCLELLVKPTVDRCDGGANFNLTDEVAVEFSRRVHNLPDWLDVARLAPASATERASVNTADETLVFLVEPDDAKAEELISGLNLYGYRCLRLTGVEQALPDSTPLPSVLIARDEAFLASDGRFAERFTDVPIICIGTTDSYPQRYALASEGAEAFYCEPLNLPLLADHLENLLIDHAEAGSGRVLIVDDDPELMEHYKLVLVSGGLDVKTVPGDPSLLLPALSEFRPDIVLMDVQMGTVSGPILARMLRFEPEWLSLPIVYLSAERDRELQLEALAKGGDDFLTKPVSDSFLLRTVRIRCYRAKQLDKLVSRDSLTGLLKHSLVKSEVANEHARCQRMNHESAVAMLDLDHFKRVNDTQGHRAGDLVIKGLANLLRHRLRQTDIIGRYGGEEFIVALPECSLSRAESIMKEVCEDFSKLGFEGNSGEFHVTLSVGLASLGRYSHPEDAIEAADQALYQRKRSGRNGVTIAPL